MIRRAALAAVLWSSIAAAQPTPPIIVNLADQTYGVACPPGADQTPCFQAALNTVQQYGQAYVPSRPDGSAWSVGASGACLQVSKSIHLYGDGIGSKLHGCVSAQGTASFQTFISAPTNYMDIGFGVSSIAGVAPGNYISIAAPTVGGGVLALISKAQYVNPSVSPAGVVQIFHPLPAQTVMPPPRIPPWPPTFSVLQPIEGLEIDHLAFDGTGLVSASPPGGQFTGLNLAYTARARIHDLAFTNYDGSALFSYMAFQNEYGTMTCEQCGGMSTLDGSATTAGMTLFYETQPTLRGNLHFLNSYGVALVVGPTTYGNFSGGSVSAIYSWDAPFATPGFYSGRGVKFLSAYETKLPSVLILNNPSTGLAIAGNSTDNIGGGGIIKRIGYQPTSQPDGICVWFNGTGNSHNNLDPLVLDSCNLWSFQVGLTDNNNALNALRWGNNGGVTYGAGTTAPNSAP